MTSANNIPCRIGGDEFDIKSFANSLMEVIAACYLVFNTTVKLKARKHCFVGA
jgi:hypothetical protein